MDWIVSPQNVYIEAQTPIAIVFGDMAFRR